MDYPDLHGIDADRAVAAQCCGDSAVSCPECGWHQSDGRSWIYRVEQDRHSLCCAFVAPHGGFLLVPPAFLGSAIYNLVALVALICLMVEYLSTHTEWSHRAMGITYLLGVGGWLYYQIVSTIYSFIGTVQAPPFVYEAHRGGRALGLVQHPGDVGLWTGRFIPYPQSAATPPRHLVLGNLRIRVYSDAVFRLPAPSV